MRHDRQSEEFSIKSGEFFSSRSAAFDSHQAFFSHSPRHGKGDEFNEINGNITIAAYDNDLNSPFCRRHTRPRLVSNVFLCLLMLLNNQFITRRVELD